jgi:mannose-1-phosphate guanylyltransferase
MYKNSLVKHLFIKKGEHISYQKHNHRNEIWTIVDGIGEFVLNDEIKKVKSGDVLMIKQGDKHALRAVEDLHFIEVQIGSELSEDDIERYDHDWK